MVFIALPALQRNQRDTQRKNDISRLQEAIERYKANNKGQLPWEVGVIGDHNTSNFANNYLKRDQGEWRDPSGSPYRVTVNVSKPGNMHTGYSYYMDRPNGDYRILIAVAARCSGETFEWGDHPNSYVLLYSFEGGGRVCADG